MEILMRLLSIYSDLSTYTSQLRKRMTNWKSNFTIACRNYQTYHEWGDTLANDWNPQSLRHIQWQRPVSNWLCKWQKFSYKIGMLPTQTHLWQDINVPRWHHLQSDRPRSHHLTMIDDPWREINRKQTSIPVHVKKRLQVPNLKDPRNENRAASTIWGWKTEK